MAPTNTYDVTQPPDTQAANLLGLDLRNLALNVQQRMALISGLAANIWNPGADAQPANWTGLLYFATDTGKISQWGGTAWVDVTADFLANAASYVTVGGLGAPNIVASVFLTGITTSVGSTLLYAVPAGAAGLYRVSANLLFTASGSGGTIAQEVVHNNGILQTTYSFGATTATLTPGEESETPSVTFYSAASENINYFITFNSVTGSPVVNAYYRVEYLG